MGIGHNGGPIPSNTDWKAIEDLSFQQGLSAVVLDGIEHLPNEVRPPKELLLQWIGKTLQTYEYRYELYRRAIAELASWHNSNGYKMMVLKGYACSLNWPNPEHRPCGDIDIWQFGRQLDADNTLIRDKGIKIDNSEQHHTIFYWQDFMVENHYDFLDVHHHQSNVKLEQILKELGQDDTYSVILYGVKVYLPSPNLHALFLLKHAMAHFAATEINLRQLLDWAFFVKEWGKKIDWQWLEDVLGRFGMLDLYYIFNAICIDDLGFSKASFHEQRKVDPGLKDKVLTEILSPVSFGEMPNRLIKRVVWKFRRWKTNEWKHKLCYKESMWSAFWSGVWGHLLKPKTI